MRILLILFSLLAPVIACAESLPPAPSAYSWQRLPEIKGALLKPEGWFFKHTAKPQTDAFFITQEDIDHTGSFTTGISFHCVRGVLQRTGQTPSAYASSFAQAVASKHVLSEVSESNQGLFKAVRFRYVDAPADKESITIHQLLIANDKTGTLYLVIFEAPTRDWEHAWHTGEIILKLIWLDDAI